jgi:glycosyltransferase involved in cell wall biosynthesis
VSPLVSVVIPTYNRAADLRRALKSVIGQTWTNWEVLVVDNHSTDDTGQMVESLREARIRLLSVHNHGVIAVSRNLGVASSAGDYVAFLDSDDWWSRRKLQQSVRALTTGADLVYHDLYLARSARGGLRLRRSRTRALASPVFDDLIEGGNALSNSGVVVRRNLLVEVGGLSVDPKLVSWEDYDCWLRLAKVTEAFSRIAEPLGYYWSGGGNFTSAEQTMINLRHFREIYLAPAGRLREEDMPGWYHYGMGRAYYHLNDYENALRSMELAIRGRLPGARRFKAVMTLGESWIRRWAGAFVA